MCNWKWAGFGFAGLPGLVAGGVTDHSNKKKDDALARSKALQEQLDVKTKQLTTAADMGDAIENTGKVLDPEDTKKRTIKSLNIPLNSVSSGGTGLNV